jgi:hypothetical protein
VVCIRCGGEDFGIVRTERNRTGDNKYSRKSDRRLYRCGTCQKLYWVECAIHTVAVYDPETMNTLWVEPGPYEESWLPKEQAAFPGQENLFKE